MISVNGESYSKAWIYEVSRFIAYATPEMREEIRKSVEKWVANEDADCVVSGYCDCSKAVELGKTRYSWGPCYLYIWLDKDGKPFYAGKADGGTRMADYKYNTRSSEFQAKIAEGGCHSVKVVKHVASENIDDMERWLISYLCWKGYSLVNKKDLPSKEKMVLWSLFTKYEKYSDVVKDLGESAASLFQDWKTDMGDYAPIIMMLDGIVGVPWEGECAEL